MKLSPNVGDACVNFAVCALFHITFFCFLFFAITVDEIHQSKRTNKNPKKVALGQVKQ
jgi:uncharacterized protein with PQ loop repeat